MYAAFASGAQLQYGPAFRQLQQAWAARGDEAVSSLHARQPSAAEGTRVHPADLDGALQLTVLLELGGGAGTRLPFAVDSSVLVQASSGSSQ